MVDCLHSNGSIIACRSRRAYPVSSSAPTIHRPGELEEKGIYKKEGAVVGKKMKKMLQGGFGDFYSIATVACGNAAMVSTVATQRVVIRGSPKPKTLEHS